MSRRLVLAVGLLCLATAHVASAQATRVGSVRGTVRDSLGRPLARVEVRMMPEGPTVRTDASGAFIMRNLEVGERRIMARLFGFRPELSDVFVDEHLVPEITIVLEELPATLSPVVVRDSALVPMKYRYTTRFDDFFLHRATAVNGAFFDAQDLERLGGPTRALAGLPGVRASEFLGNVAVRFSRCPSASQPTVFVNGIQSSASVLNTIVVTSIELMEVYRSVAEMPASARGNGCGAIALYTR
jgi:hypothetical protein